MEFDDLGAVALAAGALGTAAFGIVEGLKPRRVARWSLGLAGFVQFEKNLGPLWATLAVAYGANFREMLEGIYQGSREEVERTLRHGIRVGLTERNAPDAAGILHTIRPAELVKAAAIIEKGKPLPDNLKNVVGRYELAADARVDAALRLAETHYVSAQQIAAMVVALTLAIVAGVSLYGLDQEAFVKSLIVGVAAVPLAPIAKDVATALQSAAQSLRRRA